METYNQSIIGLLALPDETETTNIAVSLARRRRPGALSGRLRRSLLRPEVGRSCASLCRAKTSRRCELDATRGRRRRVPAAVHSGECGQHEV
jgi:hypothetical protein